MTTTFYMSEDGEVLSNREHPVFCPDYVLPIRGSVNNYETALEYATSVSNPSNFDLHFRRYTAYSIDLPLKQQE